MKYRKGSLYQLVEDIYIETPLTVVNPWVIDTTFISLHPNGIMVIRAGYAWDGASGPTLNTDNSMVPSLFHDAAAQLMRQGLLPQEMLPSVNAHFDYMLKKRGMSWLRRKMWQRGLWLTAGSFANPENAREVFEVH